MSFNFHVSLPTKTILLSLNFCSLHYGKHRCTECEFPHYWPVHLEIVLTYGGVITDFKQGVTFVTIALVRIGGGQGWE